MFRVLTDDSDASLSLDDLHFSQIGFTDDLTFMVLPPFTNVTPKIRCKWT